MSSKPDVESRRSTRVPLKVVIREWITDSLICDGETIIVNLHGALISTAVALSKRTRIEIQVFLTDKRAQAEVVYVDPQQPLHCGIALAKPQNICKRQGKHTIDRVNRSGFASFTTIDGMTTVPASSRIGLMPKGRTLAT